VTRQSAGPPLASPGPGDAGPESRRVGIVTKWFNRGQPIVGRYMRSAVDSLGHESFVLARPRREQGPRPGALERTGIWDQPGVTEASQFQVPLDEYVAWIEENGIEVLLCDQNYQLAELAALRERGVKVVGRFVWEHFTADHIPEARAAYDTIYSITEAEQARYAKMGLETPRVPWGIHPELLTFAPDNDPDNPRSGEEIVAASEDRPLRFVFPGGFIGHRKPLEPVVEAFNKVKNPDIRLLVKAQVERDRLDGLSRKVKRDRRIELHLADEEWSTHLRTIASCDVCITPSRWEGLGLPLYEAIAFAQPVITNDDPPMNEVIRDGKNGILVPSEPDGTARSGIPARRPDIDAMAKAIEHLADPDLRRELTDGAMRARTKLSWERTTTALGRLIA
jgi:1,2-diacylglycerol 3-alpha-glucosyltransferase